MRGWTIAAALLVTAACTSSAGAQAADAYIGTWAFQTDPYSAGDSQATQVAAVMSGVAVISAGAENRYDIRLLAHEYISASSGRSLLLTARENCHGEVQDAQFSITCEMAEPLEGYAPDGFILQQGEADELQGVLTSASSANVTFSRMR